MSCFFTGSESFVAVLCAVVLLLALPDVLALRTAALTLLIFSNQFYQAAMHLNPMYSIQYLQGDLKTQNETMHSRRATCVRRWNGKAGKTSHGQHSARRSALGIQPDNPRARLGGLEGSSSPTYKSTRKQNVHSGRTGETTIRLWPACGRRVT